MYKGKSDKWLGENVQGRFLVLPLSEFERIKKQRGITKRDMATMQDAKRGNQRVISLNPYSTDLDVIFVKKYAGLHISEVG